MNIINLASILGDTALAVLTAHPVILGQLNSILPEEHRCDAKHTGDDILNWLGDLPIYYKELIVQLDILSVTETQTAIHDITCYRQSEDFRNQEADAGPNRLAALIAITTICVASMFVLFFVLNVTGNGDILSGAVYDFLVGIVKWVKKPWA